MTTLTLIWNDRHCAGISDHHWHTMEFEETHDYLKVQGQWTVAGRMIKDFYCKNMDNIILEGETAADLAKSALEDIGLVGLFVGVPEEL